MLPRPVDEEHKHFLLGFLNFFKQLDGRCPAAGQEVTLVYVSLLMPDTLAWIADELRCGPDRFSCDNGTWCLELRHVCANGM